MFEKGHAIAILSSMSIPKHVTYVHTQAHVKMLQVLSGTLALRLTLGILPFAILTFPAALMEACP